MNSQTFASNPDESVLHSAGDEAMLRALMDNALNVIAVLDSEGRIKYQSASIEPILGYTAPEMIGRNAFEWIHPDDVERAGDALQWSSAHPAVAHPAVAHPAVAHPAVAHPAVAHSVECRFRHRDGSWRVLEARGRNLLDHPQIGGFVINLRDVTPRRAAEDSLREGAERKSDFLTRAGEMLADSLDLLTTFERVAQLAVPFLADWCFVDWLEDDFYRRVAVAFATSESESDLAARRDLAARFRRRFPLRSAATIGTASVMRSGQNAFWPHVEDAMLSAAAVDDEHLSVLRELGARSAMALSLKTRGRTLGVLTLVATSDSGRIYTQSDLDVARDVARLAALALDNARLYSEAERVNEAKDDFLSILSHELRTPLTPILGWVHLLRNQKPDAETYQRGLQIIESNARAQERLIEDLIDVSRIVSNRLLLNRRPLDLSSLVKSAIEAQRGRVDAKELQWDVALGKGIGRVLGDEIRLRQAVGNLLENAVKFTPEGGRIAVQLSSDGSQVQLAIADSGRGIQAEFLPRLFERFAQADGSDSRAEGGLGLGLAIVRHIIDHHDGRVRGQSEGAGHGATFTIELPLLQPHAASSAPTQNTSDLNSASHPEAPRHSMAVLEGLKVLLVDDQADALQLIDTMLSRCGVKVRTASSPVEAFPILLEWRPDVLICACAPMGEDGIALLERVRSLPATEGGATPAIAVTAQGRAEDREQAVVAGFQMHLTKPVDPVALATAIIQLISA